ELRGELRALRSATKPQAPTPPAELLQEIASLRSLIEGMSPPEKKGDRLANAVRALGIEGTHASTILRALKGKTIGEDGIDEALRDVIADIVRVTPWPLATNGRVLIGVVGPSGVGKTTTCAKLAARAILDHERTVKLIACDTFRVGAIEQLRRYADL